MEEKVVLVNPSAALIQSSTPYQQIEIAGRACYQSKSSFTEETSANFCKQMIQSKHGAMLEHGVFVFKITMPTSDMETAAHTYSVLKSVAFAEVSSYVSEDTCLLYVAISLRTLLNNAGMLSQLKVTASFGEIIDNAYPGLDLCSGTEFVKGTDTGSASVSLMTQEEMYEELPRNAILQCVFLSIRYITDRGVSHELVRHRVASFAQESTRYCNYSKDVVEKVFSNLSKYGRTTNCNCL